LGFKKICFGILIGILGISLQLVYLWGVSLGHFWNPRDSIFGPRISGLQIYRKIWIRKFRVRKVSDPKIWVRKVRRAPRTSCISFPFRAWSSL